MRERGQGDGNGSKPADREAGDGGAAGGGGGAVGGWAYLYRKAETCAESATAAALPHRSATTTAPAVGGKVTSFFRHRHRRAAATERSRQGHGQGLRILPTAPDMVLSAATIKGEEPVVECAEESNWSDTFGVLLRHRRGRSFFFFAFFLFFFCFFFCLFFFNLIGGRLTTFGLFSFLFFNGRPKKQVPIGQRSEIFVFSAIGKSGPTNDVVIN